MVRVNHPPGGHTGFQTQTSREPQTVRILQPPGGSSSISFSDDSQQVKNGSRSPSEKASSPGPSVNTQEPKFEKVSSSPEDSSNQNGEKGKISDEKSSDLSNGAENHTSNECEQPENESKDFPLPRDFESTASKSTEVTVSDNEVEVEVSESHSEKQSEVAVSEVSSVTEASVSSSTETSESSKVEVSSVSEHKTEEVSNESVNITKESYETIKESESENISQKMESSEVVKNRDLPPLQIQRNERSSAETTTYSPSSPSPSEKHNGDTRNRVMGQQAEKPTPQQGPPRKIKDHMRSNIFMSDEDYVMPVRSSRMNATVNATPKQDLPPAGQRQRIPPGGFSTKLW